MSDSCGARPEAEAKAKEAREQAVEAFVPAAVATAKHAGHQSLGLEEIVREEDFYDAPDEGVDQAAPICDNNPDQICTCSE